MQKPRLEEVQVVASRRLGSGVGSLEVMVPQVRVTLGSRLTLGQDYCRLGSPRRSGSPLRLLLEGHLLRKSVYNHSSLPDIPPTQGPPIIWVSSGSSEWDEEPPVGWDSRTTWGRSPCPWPPRLPHLIWRRPRLSDLGPFHPSQAPGSSETSTGDEFRPRQHFRLAFPSLRWGKCRRSPGLLSASGFLHSLTV